MDYVLEIADNLLLDRLYAATLPANISGLDGRLGGGSSSTDRDTGYSHLHSVHSDCPTTEWGFFGSTKWTDASVLSRQSPYRQFVSLSLISWLGGCLLYLVTASLSYAFVFDKRTLDHPRFLPHQVRGELCASLGSLPLMALPTAAIFLAEVRGYSLLYDGFNHGPAYFVIQAVLFVAFSDFLIYWIHRALHHPLLYARLHKPHHRWQLPTPFASHAFHPLDGLLQSLPYHLFPFVVPTHKLVYLAFFVFVNLWTVLIHDGLILSNNTIVNGTGCHSVHHFCFNYNFGQYTTLWDRLAGSYRQPTPELVGRLTHANDKPTPTHRHTE